MSSQGTKIRVKLINTFSIIYTMNSKTNATKKMTYIRFTKYNWVFFFFHQVLSFELLSKYLGFSLTHDIASTTLGRAVSECWLRIYC